MTTAISSASAAAATAATATSGPTIGKDATEDRFLKLLIAQMKNQDPLNPMDNAQVTSQMAQINTVQGIAQMNASLLSMIGQFQSSQAISLPGHQVLVDGNGLTLSKTADGLAAKGGFNLNQDADRVTVDVKDSTGKLVTTLNLGAQTAGPGTFSWNGQADSGTATAGSYTFDIKAYSGTTAVSATALQAALVTGTANTADGVRLTLDGMGAVNYSAVRMVI
jgi:flagellar basal-body rod modification protein FlgD